MKVLVISKSNFNSVTYTNVTNIAFASNTYTITAGSTYSYSADDYEIAVLW